MSVYLIEKRDPGLIDAAREALVTQHVGMMKVVSRAERVSRSMVLVLIQGESGTGKELLARLIHAASERRGPFIGVNCACLPEGLVESELFGHERGAFTSADRRSIGWFEQAQGGTLLLDEISEMPFHLQAKLLRVLQEKEIFRVGGKERVALDVRIVATTNWDLTSLMVEGRFRSDLFYRLNAVPLFLPPLRDRLGDVPILVEHFLARPEAGGKRMSAVAKAMLRGQRWPGNVRELENLILRGAMLAEGPEIQPADLLIGSYGQGELKAKLPTVKEMQTQLLAQALIETNGCRQQAANLLGVSARTVRNWLR